MHLVFAEMQRRCTLLWRAQGRLRSCLTLASSEGAIPSEIPVLMTGGQY